MKKTESGSEWIELGEITSPHGVMGWVKIYSHTSPREQIFDYDAWYLLGPAEQRAQPGRKPKIVKLQEWREQGKGVVAKLQGYDGRDAVEDLRGQRIAIKAQDLPELEEDEYYWRDLIGLKVVLTDDESAGQNLGKVTALMETGSNDVLVVKGDHDSVDMKERLIPYTEDAVLAVDLAKGEIAVDWDPEF